MIETIYIIQDESTIVREAPFVVQSAGITTSHSTGSTFSGKLSEMKVVMIDVFPTRARRNEQHTPLTISDHYNTNVLMCIVSHEDYFPICVL